MNNQCDKVVVWDGEWWPMHAQCSKAAHDKGCHIAEFRSFGGRPQWAILKPGETMATVYVDTTWKPNK